MWEGKVVNIEFLISRESVLLKRSFLSLIALISRALKKGEGGNLITWISMAGNLLKLTFQSRGE